VTVEDTFFGGAFAHACLVFWYSMQPDTRKAVITLGVLFMGIAVLSVLTFTQAVQFVFVLPLYMLPTEIAAGRNVSAVYGIGALNLLLGWTLIGWVLALVCALATQQKLPPNEV
jgi:hypothetical protein